MKRCLTTIFLFLSAAVLSAQDFKLNSSGYFESEKFRELRVMYK